LLVGAWVGSNADSSSYGDSDVFTGRSPGRKEFPSCAGRAGRDGHRTARVGATAWVVCLPAHGRPTGAGRDRHRASLDPAGGGHVSAGAEYDRVGAAPAV